MSEHERGTLAGEAQHHLNRYGQDTGRYRVRFHENGYWDGCEQETTLVVDTWSDREIAWAERTGADAAPYRIGAPGAPARDCASKAEAVRLLVAEVVGYDMAYETRRDELDDEPDAGRTPHLHTP